MAFRKLPIGIEDFETMRRNGYYYVDKTGMIAELLGNLGMVNLFVRPRRFGKSLTMSMLKCFFEVGADQALFDGLAISDEQELCTEHMGKYPVISLSLKEVRGLSFDEAMRSFYGVIRREAGRFDHLQNSDVLCAADKVSLMQLRVSCEGCAEEAILELSKILYNHYHQKVIILIDEYDVPLQKAEEENYYHEMVNFISKFFGSSMKTNPYMAFAVVTGCLRISKESIFTGFNNPKIHTVADERYDEWFGFTDQEVRGILSHYDRLECYDLTREWYDGYLFGKEYMYCPWDVINWCDKIARTSDRFPENYWANSSGNHLIRRFADIADDETKEQLEMILAGGSITKKLNLEVTYDELDSSIDHIWSVLFMTGYLTFKGRDENGAFILRIPNREIMNLFRGIFEKWFMDKVKNDKDGIRAFWEGLEAEDTEKMKDNLDYMLVDSVSYMDSGKKSETESFYHGLMLGILKSRPDWIVKSNREAGNGRLDAVIFQRRGKDAMIFEFKCVKDETKLEEAAYAALEQISKQNYDSYFTSQKPTKITHYGIAFYRKKCLVVKG